MSEVEGEGPRDDKYGSMSDMEPPLRLQPASPANAVPDPTARPSNRGRASTVAMNSGLAGSPRIDYDMAPGGSESPALPEVQALGEMLGAHMGGKMHHASPTAYMDSDDESEDRRERQEQQEWDEREAERARILAQQRAEEEAWEAARAEERAAEAERRAAEANERLAQQRREEAEQAEREASLRRLADEQRAEAEAAERERMAQRERALEARKRDEEELTKQQRDRARSEAALLRERQAQERIENEARRRAAEAAAAKAAAEELAQAEQWRRAAENSRRNYAEDEARRRAAAERRRREWAELELSLTLKAKPYARDFVGLAPPPVYATGSAAASAVRSFQTHDGADHMLESTGPAEIYRRAMAKQQSIFDPPDSMTAGGRER